MQYFLIYFDAQNGSHLGGHMGGLSKFLGGHVPPQAPPWRRHWAHAQNVKLHFPFNGSLPTFYILIFISTLPTQHTMFKNGHLFKKGHVLVFCLFVHFLTFVLFLFYEQCMPLNHA